MKGITLSEKHGLNPHLTKCTVCGEPGEDIILSGNAKKYSCSRCGMKYIGRPSLGECYKCGGFHTLVCQGEPDPSERFPGLCKNHREEQEQHDAKIREEIDRGGVPWACTDCLSTGVIKAESEMALRVREWAKKNSEQKDRNGNPIAGVKLSKGNGCPVCMKGGS